jgi:hypothetical protein
VLTLGGAKFTIFIPPLSQSELESYTTTLFDSWEAQVDKELDRFPDYALYLDVEEGSLKGTGRIVARLSNLAIAVGIYGGIVQGVQIINLQVKVASECLKAKAVEPFADEGTAYTARASSGKLGRLERLFKKVEKGDLDPEIAAFRAAKLFEEDAESCPQFVKDIFSAIQRLSPGSEQLNLMPDWHPEPMLPSIVDEKRSIQESDRPSRLPQEKYRIEVWRETKRQTRRMRIRWLRK